MNSVKLMKTLLTKFSKFQLDLTLNKKVMSDILINFFVDSHLALFSLAYIRNN